MVNYEFRYIVKMTNGKEYEIITNFHGEKDVLKYIDSHDYIDLFDRKIEQMVAVKSEYVMSVLYKDSQKTDSEGNTDWANREDYLKEENERLERENRFLLSRKDNLFDSWRDENKRSVKLSKKLEQLEQENEQLKKEKKVNRTKASLLTQIEILKKENEELKDKLKD